MPNIDPPRLLKHFTDLPDPREARGIRHNLADIICIAVLAVIYNANSLPEIHTFALLKQDWLNTFLELLDH
jgi:DDE_Tnp_1-associated